MLIDSHCHLDFPDFADDIDGVIGRAKAAGVGRLITISTRVKRFDAIAALAEAHPDVFCTVGTHPHQAAEEPDVTAAELIRLAAHPKCVAIGEAGLDYHYDKTPREIAARVFRTHIAAAREIRAAACHPLARRRCGHGRDPGRGNGARPLSGRAALLHLLGGAGPHRPRPRA